MPARKKEMLVNKFAQTESEMIALGKTLYACSSHQDRWLMLQAAKSNPKLYRELASIDLGEQEVINAGT